MCLFLLGCSGLLPGPDEFAVNAVVKNSFDKCGYPYEEAQLCNKGEYPGSACSRVTCEIAQSTNIRACTARSDCGEVGISQICFEDPCF